jgi:hypothetical protein
MSRKLAIILIAIVVAMAFGAPAAFSADAPDTVTIKKVGDKKSAVTFSHAGHAKTIDCFTCHHAAKTKEEIKGCAECHGKDEKASPAKTAYHNNCKGCHQKQKAGPTKCNDCHPK